MPIFWFAIFIISLFTLIQASRFFTNSAEKLGLILGIPSFMVGVTIVSIGTTLPELISSIFAVLNGASEMVVGNVIGSIVTNIFLIFGITAIVAGNIHVTRQLLSVDLSFLVGSSFLLATAILDHSFSRFEAVLFIAVFFVYALYALTLEREGRYGGMVENHIEQKLEYPLILVIVISPIFIYFGARYTIEAVIQLSQALHIGTEIIAASVIALGTSLPELAVSLSAVARGKAELAVGNILGANIFNAFAVMGVSALFGALVIPQSMITFGIPMLLIATFLYYFATGDNKITKWEGWMLIIFYLLFISELFTI